MEHMFYHKGSIEVESFYSLLSLLELYYAISLLFKVLICEISFMISCLNSCNLTAMVLCFGLRTCCVLTFCLKV
jgi:hypothetical protein